MAWGTKVNHEVGQYGPYSMDHRYHKLRKAFSRFYRRYSELVAKYNVSLRKLLQQDILEPQSYRYHKLRKAFSKFYRRHSELVAKYNVSSRKLLQQGISEPEFYGDLVYRMRKIVGKSNFSEQFRKLINRYKRIGYNPYVMRQTACLVINPTSADGYVSLFNCATAGRALDSMTAST